MANNNTTALWVIAVVVVACLAAIIGYAVVPDCDECEVCTICEVCEPVECEVCEECSECEVIECADTANDLLNIAIEDLINHMDDKDVLKCNGDYDVDEVTATKIYDEFKVIYGDDDEYKVDGKVKLNFKQEDEPRCRKTVKFTVFYETDEDPKVTIL